MSSLVGVYYFRGMNLEFTSQKFARCLKKRSRVIFTTLANLNEVEQTLE